jgi:hypothetical protein
MYKCKVNSNVIKGSFSSLIPIAISMISLIGNSAFAESESCNSSHRFICRAVYNLKNTSAVNGPQELNSIQNNESDLRKTANCQSTIVLYTAEGKFVANYNQTSGKFNAKLEFNGRSESLASDLSFNDIQRFSALIPSALAGDIESTQLECGMERD